MRSRSLGHRAPLLWLVLPLIAGLTVGRAFSGLTPFGTLVASLGLVVLAWRMRDSSPRAWAGALVAAMMLAGAAAYSLHRARLAAWEDLPSREVRLGLRIDHVFPRAATAPTVTGLATVTRTEAHLRELVAQRIYFSLRRRPGERAPIRSAVVAAGGVLGTVPRTPPADSFDGYLAAAGINFRLNRGRILAEETPPTRYHRFCAHAATRFESILGYGLTEKQPRLAGLLRAMMLGHTHELNEEQRTLFMQSGTMHLFAISGLNIGVIALALESILRLFRLPALLRYLAGGVLLWLFVDITGGSASAVRAFIMAIFFASARAWRRPGNPLAALAASTLVVLLCSPLEVLGASFLMSYSIVGALFLFGVPLADAGQERWAPWRDLPRPAWRWWHHGIAAGWRKILSALAVGIAATLVSLLTGVQFFGMLTPGSLLTNLVLIPAAMVATAGGFAALLAGLAGFDSGVLVSNHAAALTLLAIEAIVAWSVRWPGAFLPATFAAPWIGPASLTLLLAVMTAGYATDWKRAGRWWPPVAVVGLTLIFGVRYGAA
jgi:competence protein ComEC